MFPLVEIPEIVRHYEPFFTSVFSALSQGQSIPEIMRPLLATLSY